MGTIALPYPPLTLVLDIPAAALGDVRWTFVVATAAAAFLIRGAGPYLPCRRARGHPAPAPTRDVRRDGALLTEPIVLTAVCGAALLASSLQRAQASGAKRPGSSWILLGLVAGLALASKQYTPLLLLPLLPLVAARQRWRVAGTAAAVCAASYLPFILWDAGALWRGVVTFQLVQPFRPDSLSWPAAVASWGGPRLPPWPAFVAAAGVAIVTMLRARSAAGAIAGGAAAWLVLVIGNKQAFCNYYWLGAGLLCAAIAASARPDANGLRP